MKNLHLKYLILLLLSISCKKEIERNDFYENLEKEKKEKLLFNIGKVYFENNCKGCHNKYGTDNFLVYGIKNDKYKFVFLRAFINNQDSLIKNGNETAIKMNEEYNNFPYRHKFKLNDNEIKSILYYLKN
ncbi:hypothetical protein [Flavobacterium pedocola]